MMLMVKCFVYGSSSFVGTLNQQRLDQDSSAANVLTASVMDMSVVCYLYMAKYAFEIQQFAA